MLDGGQEILAELEHSNLWRCDCGGRGGHPALLGYKDPKVTRRYAHLPDCRVVRWQQIQAWHLAHWGQLTLAQRKSLQKIWCIIIKALSDYHNLTPEDMPPLNKDKADREYIVKATIAYEKAMLKAIRAGLLEHPLIREWWHTKANTHVDAWRLLRRAKQGLEKLANPPYQEEKVEAARAYFDTWTPPPSLNELVVKLEIEPEIRPLLDEGKSHRTIHAILTCKRLLPTKSGRAMPWQNFDAWAKRRGLFPASPLSP